jgi:hypothetical protein
MAGMSCFLLTHSGPARWWRKWASINGPACWWFINPSIRGRPRPDLLSYFFYAPQAFLLDLFGQSSPVAPRIIGLNFFRANYFSRYSSWLASSSSAATSRCWFCPSTDAAPPPQRVECRVFDHEAAWQRPLLRLTKKLTMTVQERVRLVHQEDCREPQQCHPGSQRWYVLP